MISFSEIRNKIINSVLVKFLKVSKRILPYLNLPRTRVILRMKSTSYPIGRLEIGAIPGIVLIDLRSNGILLILIGTS